MTYEDDQTLLLDDRFFHRLVRGGMKANLRIGERAVSPGRLVFHSTSGNFRPVPVYIDRVINTTFRDLSDYDAILAGYEDAEAARQSMLYFHPGIMWSAPITVLRFERDR